MILVGTRNYALLESSEKFFAISKLRGTMLVASCNESFQVILSTFSRPSQTFVVLVNILDREGVFSGYRLAITALDAVDICRATKRLI